MSHRQILTVFSGLMLGMLLAALDQTIVATALPTIVGDLGGLGQISWVVTAYLFTSTASAPLYGKISDLYGRKIVFQTAISVFLVGSGLSGIAQSMGQLIGFRALQGLGAGGLMVMAMTIIGDIISPRERGKYQGYIGSVFAFASVAGPLLGGFLVDNLSWRWVFYINVPVGVAALIVTGIVLHLPVSRTERKVDYLGAALLVAAVTSVLLVTVWGGNEYAWDSPAIIGLAVSSVVLIAAFVYQESRIVEPILPLRLFRNQVFTISSAAGLVAALIWFGVIVFIPLFLQVVSGVSATDSGLLLIPLMAGVVTTSVASGRLITRTGRYKRYPIVGSGLMTVGMILLSTMSPETPMWMILSYLLILGSGIGLVIQVLVLAVQNAVDRNDLGVATSSIQFFRSLGGSLGTAIFGAVMAARLTGQLVAHVPSAALGTIPTEDLTGSPELISQLPDAIQTGVIEAFANSITTTFLVAVPFALLALVLVVMLPERPLREDIDVTAPAIEGGALLEDTIAETGRSGSVGKTV